MDITGKNLVLSGIAPGHSRGTAQAALQERGGYVQSSMSSSTELLVVGAKPGAAKVKKAKEMGIPIVEWSAVMDGAASTTTPAPAPELATARIISPQLALAGELPGGDGWYFEVKWDGYRCISTVIDGQVSMQSRSGRSEYLESFPKVAEQLAGLPDVVLDGELVAVTEDGISNFETVRGGGMEGYIVFDLLSVDGRDCRGLPLSDRQLLLRELIGKRKLKHVGLSQTYEDGEELLEKVKADGLEGVVAKRKSSRYVEGSRSSDWLKIKVRTEQEFVIVGYTIGEGSRSDSFGALILAYYAEGELTYAGKVGTGFDDTTLRDLTDRMGTLRAVPLPEDFPREIRRDGVGVEPVLVGQVAFQRWTGDGLLWHPSYLGLRADKQAIDVVRE